MKYIVMIASVFTLTGCSIPEYGNNQEIRRELFRECMGLLPNGPDTTMYNDWSEVVSECRDYAYYGSRFCTKNCGGEK